MKEALKSMKKPPEVTKFKLEEIHITEEKVFKVLKTMATYKVSGPVKISAHMLTKCTKELALLPHTKLFRNCIGHKKRPKVWEKANVVAINKKCDKSFINNYRPVSLMSCLGKVPKNVSALTRHLQSSRLISMK